MIHTDLCLTSSRNVLTPAKSFALILSAILAAFFVCVNIHAAEQLQTYTVADGLVGPIVPVIFQDSRGMLWFGSDQNGVSRFDGNTFEPYAGSLNTLDAGPSDKVKSGALLGRTLQIVEDKWGHIWFLTRMPSEPEGRVSRFDGTAINLIGNGNTLIVDRLGDVWVGENQRLTKYVSPDAQRPPQAQPNEIIGEDLLRSTDLTINVIFQSEDGTLWLGGSEGEEQQTGVILSFRESRWRRAPLNDDESDKTDDGTPRMQVSSGFVRYDMSDLRTVGAVEAIAEDAAGNIWFGGYNLLLRFDGKNFEQILPLPWAYRGSTPRRSLVSTATRKPTTIRSDSRGRVWFSDEHTTRWWDGSRLRTGTNLSGYLEAEDAWGNLWFTNENGPQQYNADLEPISYTTSSGLENDQIHTIFEAVDGKLWFGHDNGATAFDPIPAISTHAGIGTNRVRMMYEDSRGYLWFSVLGGVARYNADTEETTTDSLSLSFTEDMSSPAQVNATNEGQTRVGSRTEIAKIFEVDGHIWFVNFVDPRLDGRFTRYTFFRYANGKFDGVSISIIARIGPGGEGADINPEVLVTDGEHRWMAFGGHLFKADTSGLLRLTKTGFQRILFGTTSEIDHGEAAITDLYRDPNDRLWVHFGNGKVLRYPKKIHLSTPRTRAIGPEILPLKATMLLKSALGSKWLFNSVTGKLILWSDTELGEPLLLDGEFSSTPLAVWKDATQQNNRITFLFSDALKTYQSTKLVTTTNIELAPVNASLISQDGALWLATSQGVAHYDGKRLITYTTKDGFLVDNVRDVMEDSRGNIWFATRGGGTVRYDGETFYTLTTKDGLAHNNIWKLYESTNQDIWFATEGGATQYTPTRGGLPFCRLTTLEADKIYTQLSANLTLPARGTRNIIFDVQGISPLRENLSYQFRLIGLDTPKWTNVSGEMFSLLTTNTGTLPGEWINPTTFTAVDVQPLSDSGVTQTLQNRKGTLRIRYTGLKAGNYSFLVKAFRKEWPYTHPPAVVDFNILPPLWTRWRTYLPTLIFITVVFALLGRLIVNRRHTVQLRNEVRQREEAEMNRIRAELSEAQNIQMGLLPTEAPDTKGFDVAGMSVPATQVGGDFFDYVTVSNGQTAIAVADAAGKGLRGAMNAVLTNGMLYEVSRFKSEADVILSDLNAGLAPRMYGPSFIALNLAILDETKRQIDYANGGQPYPVLKRGNNIIEIENSDLPLGSMKRVQYESATFNLSEGDILIFHTDGLIEALNVEEEMYGTDRLKESVSRIPDSCNAAEVVQHIVNDVHNFVGEAEQYDDMTIVVVRIPEVS
ncbi:MAG: SpoIIE family protein phosphatase [Candidatus Poribacteria bacterium]|nr:SpoIIE family protein phosphatase [Candidatus Poribacteria bacterium]